MTASTVINRNEELVARTREFIGPDIELMLDCWMAFDVEFAVRLAERLRPYGLRWIEDCLTPENLGRPSRACAAPAVADPRDRRALVRPAALFAHAAQPVADIFQPDICWAGGFTGLMKINAIAEAAGIEVILHAGMNTPYGQHFTYASPNTRWGEYFVGADPVSRLRRPWSSPAWPCPQRPARAKWRARLRARADRQRPRRDAV
jgi:L-rhamnonate dehydratase